MEARCGWRVKTECVMSTEDHDESSTSEDQQLQSSITEISTELTCGHLHSDCMKTKPKLRSVCSQPEIKLKMNLLQQLKNIADMYPVLTACKTKDKTLYCFFYNISSWTEECVIGTETLWLKGSPLNEIFWPRPQHCHFLSPPLLHSFCVFLISFPFTFHHMHTHSLSPTAAVIHCVSTCTWMYSHRYNMYIHTSTCASHIN